MSWLSLYVPCIEPLPRPLYIDHSHYIIQLVPLANRQFIWTFAYHLRFKLSPSMLNILLSKLFISVKMHQMPILTELAENQISYNFFKGLTIFMLNINSKYIGTKGYWTDVVLRSSFVLFQFMLADKIIFWCHSISVENIRFHHQITEVL